MKPIREERAWQKHRHARKDGTCARRPPSTTLVQEVYEPKTADEKHTERSPTTSTGVPVEQQVRKE